MLCEVYYRYHHGFNTQVSSIPVLSLILIYSLVVT